MVLPDWQCLAVKDAEMHLEHCGPNISSSMDGLPTYRMQHVHSIDIVFLFVTQVPALQQTSTGRKNASNCGCMIFQLHQSSLIMIFIVIHHSSSYLLLYDLLVPSPAFFRAILSSSEV